MPSENFQRLVDIMARLRGPDGCPWDREQTIQTLRRYLIEEAYEVLDAMEREDWPHLAEELGDLQLQIVFQAQIAAEAGNFTIDDVLSAINEKLVRRHPHVFADESAATPGDVLKRWEEIKATEAAAKRAGAGPSNESEPRVLLDRVRRTQPALPRGNASRQSRGESRFRLGQFQRFAGQARRRGPRVTAGAGVARGGGRGERLEEELGDLLFMAVNIARHVKVDPELALRGANKKFRERFGYIERRLAEQGRSFEESSLDELEELWKEAKSPPSA